MQNVDNDPEDHYDDSYEGRQQYIEEVLPLIKEKNNRSFSMERLEWGWREKTIIECWIKNDQLWSKDWPSYVHYLESRSPEFQSLSESEQTAAARGFVSALQWLATNVGSCFLSQMLAESGQKVIEEDWARDVYHPNYLIDTAKRTLEKQQALYRKLRIQTLHDIEAKLTSPAAFERENASKELQADEKKVAEFKEYIGNLEKLLEKPKVVDLKQ